MKIEQIEMSEFLNRGEEKPAVEESVEEKAVEQPEELVVQKAVVESLAADKAVQDEHISNLTTENDKLKSELSTCQTEVEPLKARVAALEAELTKLRDILVQNGETQYSDKVTLLERDTELKDRFVGETRDHVLEVLRQAKARAEEEGRLRCAQLLEGVLLVNESSGELERRRRELDKVFRENNNVITGQVLEYLKKNDISHKNGEEYLLPSEIIKRIY